MTEKRKCDFRSDTFKVIPSALKEREPRSHKFVTCSPCSNESGEPTSKIWIKQDVVCLLVGYVVVCTLILKFYPSGHTRGTTHKTKQNERLLTILFLMVKGPVSKSREDRKCLIQDSAVIRLQS